MKQLSTAQFIEKSTLVHGNKYDYSKTNYINSYTPIIIICNIHGEFTQLPDNHIYRKCGCPKCAINRKWQCKPKSLQEFIIKSNRIHNNKYDYSNSKYISAKNKIEINCNLHGKFYQTPNSHLNGCGCPSCYGNKALKITTEKFIFNANKIHNNKYDYSKTNYINRHTKLIIGCPIHGDFKQSPYAHLKYQGCPKCKKSKGEQAIENFLNSKLIQFESPKTFTTCINPNTGWNLYFDFYIPKYNLLIEFDGYQHFKPYYRDKLNLDSLTQRQERDKIKTLWAKSNNFTLLRIKYTEIRKIPILISNVIY